MRHLGKEAAHAPPDASGGDDPQRPPLARWGLCAGLIAVLVALVASYVVDPPAARARPDERAGDETKRYPIVFAQVPPDAGLVKGAGEASLGMLRASYGQGARIVRLDPDGTRKILTADFAAACEMDVSFDGQRLLFAGKQRAQDPWNIFEMNADGSRVRQVTRDLGDCRSPAYQSTLYTIVSTEPWYQVMFTSTAAGERNEASAVPATNLYTCKLDGTSARRITFNLSSDMDPFLMPDGRILLASWQRMDLRRGERGRIALFGVNADGVDYALFCDCEGSRIKHMPCSTTTGLAVFVEADRVGWDGAGRLAGVELRRPFGSLRRILSRDGQLYHAPSPTLDGRLLAAGRPADGSGTHGIVLVDPARDRVWSVYDDAAWHDMHPRLLAPRPEPDGRSSSVSEKYDWSKFYCMDAYRMEPKLRGTLPPGTIRALRVIEGVPAKAGDGAPVTADARLAHRRLMGVVPVAKDGSFQVELPPDLPIQLQTLDENGMALRTCGWIWAKQREPRGCIGCHEDPELTPENRFVDALKEPAPKLTLPPERRRTVDFRRDVMPILTKRCSPCHRENPPERWKNSLVLEGRADGGVGGAYAALMRRHPALAGLEAYRHVHPGRARTSPLIWRIFGRNTSRPWDPAWPARDRPVKRMPPAYSGHVLTPEAKQTLVEWIDLGALWDGIPGDGDERKRESR